MTQWPARLVLIGAGKMGGAMAQGWLDAGLPAASLTIVEPNPSAEIASLAASRGVALNPRVEAPPDVLVLAVKPQSLDQVAPQIAALAAERTLLLSIIAGKTIANLTARLPQARAVVRAMPNTPAAIGRGVTAAFANADVNAEQRRWCERLLGAVGAFFWLEDEGAIDAVTAISGSGPAYVFALTEALAAAARETGPAGGALDGPRTGHCRGRGGTDAPRKRDRARNIAPERHFAGRHHRRRARGAQGRSRARRSHGEGDGRGPRPRRGDGGLSGVPWRRAAERIH